MRASQVLVCLPLLTAAAGCGFVFVHGPPTGHEQLEYFSCTEDNAGPVLDIIWAALNVAGASIVAATPDEYPDAGLTVASGVAWGIFSSVSAASGFKKVAACKSARQALAQRQARRGTVPITIVDTATVAAVVITPAADTLAVGAQRQLVAVAYRSSGATAPGRTFTWSSSNDAIASVSNAGLVTARAPGSVIIAANANNVVGTATLVITGPR